MSSWEIPSSKKVTFVVFLTSKLGKKIKFEIHKRKTPIVVALGAIILGKLFCTRCLISDQARSPICYFRRHTEWETHMNSMYALQPLMLRWAPSFLHKIYDISNRSIYDRLIWKIVVHLERRLSYHTENVGRCCSIYVGRHNSEKICEIRGRSGDF